MMANIPSLRVYQGVNQSSQPKLSCKNFLFILCLHRFKLVVTTSNIGMFLKNWMYGSSENEKTMPMGPLCLRVNRRFISTKDVDLLQLPWFILFPIAFILCLFFLAVLSIQILRPLGFSNFCIKPTFSNLITCSLVLYTLGFKHASLQPSTDSRRHNTKWIEQRGQLRNREVQRQRKRISWQGNTVLNNGLRNYINKSG